MESNKIHLSNQEEVLLDNINNFLKTIGINKEVWPYNIMKIRQSGLMVHVGETSLKDEGLGSIQIGFKTLASNSWLYQENGKYYIKAESFVRWADGYVDKKTITWVSVDEGKTFKPLK